MYGTDERKKKKVLMIVYGIVKPVEFYIHCECSNNYKHL